LFLRNRVAAMFAPKGDLTPDLDQGTPRARRPPRKRGDTMKGAGKSLARGLRWSIYGLAVAATVVAISTDADARSRRRRSIGSGGGYAPPYASIVVDANTGRVLQETNPDALRHPASLTKIMTLYLLFERLDAGKLKLGTQLSVSSHAATQAPSKLGLKPGATISTEDAIRALVTKSANDAAAVIAEALAGEEDDFAEMMTSKVRALGMSRTVYRNASGLPDPAQVTTARDQATLGRAIQDRFPRYYTYFATPSFAFRGATIRNHNRLLGRVEGVDGIKTGYTHASGFNLVTSMRRNGRHIVAVVLGGRSAGARDTRMRDLVTEKIADASPKRTTPMIAEAVERTPPATTTKRPAPTRVALASAGSTPVTLAPRPAAAQAVNYGSEAADAPAQGSSEPLQPIKVKTIKVKLSGVHTAALGPPVATVPVEESGATQSVAKAAAASEPAPIINPRPGVLGVLPAPAAATVAEPVPPPVSAPVKMAAAPANPPTAPAATSPARAVPQGSWIVQVGAFPAEKEAKDRLQSAQSKAKALLGRADGFTEPVHKGDKTLYRARFAGMDKDQAEAVCKHLKRNEIACLTIKN
jgi:D-alanyl-D-alanine carboxypeptidase